MTPDPPDEITCPDCGGTGLDHTAPGLTLRCGFCHGRGVVDGPDDPHHRPPPTAPPPAWEHRVWETAELAASGWCRYCLGTATVTHTDEERRILVAAPCPMCTRAPGPD